MIALLPLLLLAACKAEDPSPLEDFVDQMEDPDWCPTSWEDGIFRAFQEAYCTYSSECDDSSFELCMEGIDVVSTPSCIRGCDVRECVEWYLTDDCDYDNEPDACRSAIWCE